MSKIDFQTVFEGPSDGILLRIAKKKTDHNHLDSLYLMVIDFFINLGNPDYQLVFSIEGLSWVEEKKDYIHPGHLNIFRLDSNDDVSIRKVENVSEFINEKNISDFFYDYNISEEKGGHLFDSYLINEITLGSKIDLLSAAPKILAYFDPEVFDTDDGLCVSITNKQGEIVKEPFLLNLVNEGHLKFRTRDKKIQKLFQDTFLKYYEDELED